MPIYTIENTETGEVFDIMLKLADRERILRNNPHWRQVPTAPNINKGGVGDRVKRDGGMNEVLSRIADNNPNSPLADDFGKKDAKSVASRKVAKKVRDSFTKD